MAVHVHGAFSGKVFNLKERPLIVKDMHLDAYGASTQVTNPTSIN